MSIAENQNGLSASRRRVTIIVWQLPSSYSPETVGVVNQVLNTCAWVCHAVVSNCHAELEREHCWLGFIIASMKERSVRLKVRPKNMSETFMAIVNLSGRCIKRLATTVKES